jgi:predicted ABC-type transport system involved in lysophospholipase L1 biosynthesis ATPase subunit
MSNHSANDETVLAAENVTKQVISPEGSLTILSDVSFGVNKGESIAIVGGQGNPHCWPCWPGLICQRKAESG